VKRSTEKKSGISRVMAERGADHEWEVEGLLGGMDLFNYRGGYESACVNLTELLAKE